ncbi:hypothetical protein ACFLZ0_02555 [Patescibacteria group bacterium]
MRIIEIIKNIKEFFRRFLNPIRIFTLLIICLFVILAGFLIYLMTGKAVPAEKIEFGVTFSRPFAQKLSLNWKDAYLAILNDLGVRKLRLVAYWSEIESNKDNYVFDPLDWQIQEAKKVGAEVILAFGMKAPRWPECHIPLWAFNSSKLEQQKELLDFIRIVVDRYKDEKTIKYWQVENEPFLRGFGECPKLDEEFLDKEIALVKELDSRPVILTTSGELSLWSEPAKKTNILGTTLYRVIYNEYFGVIHYPIPSVFYHKRAELIKRFFGVEKVFIIELQAEPWWPKQIYETELDKQFKSMNFKEFQNIIEYSRQTGFDEVYLWGVEWWYWLKTLQDDTYFWAEARKLWQ